MNKPELSYKLNSGFNINRHVFNYVDKNIQYADNGLTNDRKFVIIEFEFWIHLKITFISLLKKPEYN